MKYKDSINTVVTVGNGAELVAQLCDKILGSDTQTATSFAGSRLNAQMLHQLSSTIFQKAIAKQLGE